MEGTGTEKYLPVPLKLQEVLVFPGDWNLKVSILQIHFYHPILCLDEVWKDMQTLRFEMFCPYKGVEALEVYYWPLSPFLLFHKKNLGHKTIFGQCFSTIAPLGLSS